MPVRFGQDWIQRDRPIGEPEILVTGYVGETPVHFVVPRSVAVRFLTLGEKADLGSASSAWSALIQRACTRAYLREQRTGNDALTIGEGDFVEDRVENEQQVANRR